MILENKRHSKEVRLGNYMDKDQIVQVRQVCEELLLEYGRLGGLMVD